MATALSVIIPANNEAAFIDDCLRAVLASEDLPNEDAVQIIVVPNGCSDSTADKARHFAQVFADRGWQLDVEERAEGDKLAALDAGDALAGAANRAYLDADVIVSPQLLRATCLGLASDQPRYATGRVHLKPATRVVTQLYGRFYRQVPFITQPAPGCGFFAVNGQGRARWAQWPRIISDDTFARLSFAPHERVEVAASYQWPLVEGFANLIKVRRRQNAGVAQIAAMFPELLNNDGKPRFGGAEVMRAIAKAPLGFVVYAAVSAVVKLTPGTASDWRRGR